MADLKLALIIEALVKGAKDVAGLTGSVKDLGATATKKVPDNTEALREGAKATKLSIQDLTQAIGGLVTVGAITQFARSSIQEFAKAESAFRGLEAVANASGAGIGNALKEAEKLAADGLIGVSDASKALQNLLSRGYNLDQAVATITRLKDAAAFNRQASLSMAEAVVSATEGLKNENSILVDNAGVTKNVAKMWEEFAKQQGITTAEMTQAQKIQAEYNGILAETAAQAGNAEKAMAGFQGQMAQADQATIKFKQSLGDALAPAVAGLATLGTGLLERFFKPLVFLAQAAGVRMGQVELAFGTLWDAITTRDFSKVGETVRIQGELAEKEIEDIARRLSGGALKLTDGLTGIADPAKAKEVADKLTQGAAAAGKAQKEMAKDLKQAIESSIKDYQALAAAARDAWQKSADAEKDYRAQAAALRAKTVDADTSVEGQALARLDLIAAQEKLLRLKGGDDLDATRAQADLVRQLAGGLADQARAQEAIKDANLAEAGALEQAANAEKTRQEGLREQWKQSEQVVKDLQTALEAIGKGTAIKIESDQAKVILDEIAAKLDAIKDKTVTITVVPLSPTGQPLDNLTGGVPGHATGTILPGYGGGDRRLILAEDGEAITRKEAVAYYGRDFLAALNAMRIPRFQSGGLVMSAANRLPSLSTASGPAAPDFPHLGRIDLGLGGNSYPVYADADVARALGRAVLKLGAR